VTDGLEKGEVTVVYYTPVPLKPAIPMFAPVMIRCKEDDVPFDLLVFHRQNQIPSPK